MHGLDYEDDGDTFEYDTETVSNQLEDFVIETLDVNDSNFKNEIHVTAVVENSSFELKVDSGAKCNVISDTTIKSLSLSSKPRLNTKNGVKLVTYSKDTIPTLGTCVLHCKISDVLCPLEFQVVKGNAKTILGLRDALKLNLISLHPDVHEITPSPCQLPKPDNIPSDIWSDYSELFSDQPGCLPITYKMKLDPDVPPVVKPPRSIPHAMREKVKESLDKMEENGIIAKVTEPTEWVSSMVAAKKKNTEELRICIDPQDLNKALMRPHHPLKTLDEVVSSIPGAKIFSILDAKSAFWHIKLDKQSSYYTTFNSIYGRYRYLRMPYGITSGSEVYQRAIEMLTENTPCKVIVDDILVYGTDMADHDRNMKIVLDRLREICLRLNVNKCKFRITEVKYVGNVFTSKGLLPDPEKVTAINEMPAPEDKKSLQRFLGMTNYLSRFVENYSDKTYILRELLHDKVAWHWVGKKDTKKHSII